MTTKQLDLDAIKEILEKNGMEYTCVEDGDIYFKKDEAHYCISTGMLPAVRIGKGYNLSENTTIDWEIVPMAGRFAEDKVIMAKFRYGEKEFWEFYLHGIEYLADNFEKSLQRYLEILDSAEHCFNLTYNELHDRKMLDRQKPENRLEKMAEEMAAHNRAVSEMENPASPSRRKMLS